MSENELTVLVERNRLRCEMERVKSERDQLAALLVEKDKALEARGCHQENCGGVEFVDKSLVRKYCDCGYFIQQDAIALTAPAVEVQKAKDAVISAARAQAGTQ